MTKTNIFGTSDKRDVNPDWFTGKVWMKELSSKIHSKEQDIYHVHFPKGSRTKLHLHDGSQILIAISGKGSLVMYQKSGRKKSNFEIKITQTIKLNKGDIVYIPPKTLHTHGSVSKTVEFSHIAINIHTSKSKYMTSWFESDYKTKAYKMI